jgi:VWFA-related protein
MTWRRPFLIILAAVSLGFHILAQEKPDDVVKVDTQLVNIPVIVSDRENRYIPGLAKENFRLFRDGNAQKIDIFGNENAPMNIVLALDTSQSTTPVLDKIKKAAKEFIKDLSSEDRCMVISFDSDIHLLSRLTSDKKELKSSIESAEISETPGTLLNDAVYDAVNKTLKPVHGRKAIILLTDGEDFGSSHYQSELLDRLNESDTVIYPVYYDSRAEVRKMVQNRFPRGGGMGRFPGGMGRGGMGRFPGGGGMGRYPGGGRRGGGGGNGQRRRRPNSDEAALDATAFLQKLADVTGGHFLTAQKSDLKDAFTQIAEEMKRQYVLGFYPVDEAEAGVIHRVKVTVDRQDASVRSKTTYKTQTK